MPRGVNGEINVILNNRKNTVAYVDKNGDAIKRKGEIVVKSFTYVNMKKSGQRFNPPKDIKQQVYDWIMQNAPKTAVTKLLT